MKRTGRDEPIGVIICICMQTTQGNFLVGGGEVVGKGDRRMNMVKIMHTHVCKCKNDTC
jgi:hypothetical protein